MNASAASSILAFVHIICVVANTIDPGFGDRPSSWIIYDVPSEFESPTGLARPAFRYWVPDADVDEHILASDLEQMKISGWGGVEIICLENYGIELAVIDPAIYGYGGTNWHEKFGLMLYRADELDMMVDFALGPSRGASIPILDPDSQGMNTELAYGVVNLTAGQAFNGTVPPPGKVNPGYANAPEFHPLSSITPTIPSPDPRVVQLDYDSVQDITDLVSDGHVSYSVPSDDLEYALFGFWQRRTGYLATQSAFSNATTPDNPASWFAYVVDHFSQEGTDLWTSITEKYAMGGENGKLVRKVGAFAWEDSAEFRATLFWTDGFQTFFQKPRNYSVVHALPSLFGTTGVPASTLANVYYYYPFNDQNGTDIGKKLRNDYRQVLQELYEKYHLNGLSA